MKMIIRAAASAVLLLAILWSQPAFSQNLEEGDWRVMMYTPGGEVATAVYEVEQRSGTARATMKWRDGEIEVTDLNVDGNMMTFAWDPGFYMQCRLVRSTKRQFKGACRDSRENLGPAVFSPPGVEVTAADIDLDAAFDVWNVSKEEYIRERYPQPAEKKLDVPEPKELPSRRVEVGGRHLNVVETGSGKGTVVLESGLGDDHKVWRQVQDGLAAYARVISYDRAGLGLSDDASDDRAPSHVASELHDLLTAAGYSPPYVMVGHHTGAFTVRAFEDRYPDEVAGLVLIDPAHEEEDERYSAVDEASWKDYVTRKQTFYSAVSKAAAKEFEAYQRALQAPAIDAEADVPVVILSGQARVENPRWVGETREGLAAKNDLHRRLAKTLDADLIISTKSAGTLHLEDPDAVVQAVKTILGTIEG